MTQRRDCPPLFPSLRMSAVRLKDTMKTPTTKVIFRRNRSGEVLAIFPTIPGTNDPHTVTCYGWGEQHATATLGPHLGRLATPAEYKPLAKTLRRIGYRLRIAKRATAADYRARKGQCR
jgi:hypothetical protein